MPSNPPICTKHDIPKIARKDRPGWRCPECRAETARKRYLARRDEFLAAQREKYATDPKYRKRKKEIARAHHLITNYGITPEEFDALLSEQGGKCAICRKVQLDENHTFGVDHNHKDGRVRGILCKRCNLILGNALDNPKILRRAATYLDLSLSILSPEAEQIISNWSADEAYVYMRPLTSKWIDPTKKHRVYWKVQVELRMVPPRRWEAEGYDLNEVILSLGEKVPRRRIPNPGFDAKTKDGGYLAPKKVFQQELEEAKRKREKSERPKKRPKDLKAKRKKKKEK